MEKLSEKQKKILEFIEGFIKEKGYSPSIGEIQNNFSFHSPHAVTCHIRSIIEKGYLSKVAGKARTLTISGQKLSGGFFKIPVIGKIAAGKPVIPDGTEENFVFGKTGISGDETFALKVRGDSMEQAGIFEDDYVIVDKRKNIKNGDIVAAVIDGEATVKYFFREKDRIKLSAANPLYEPIFIKNDILLGKVTGLFREFS